MTITLLLVGSLLAIAGWWLSHQRLMAKPWLEEGVLDDYPATAGPPVPTVKIGLGVFLAVVACLFALFASAYTMRMGMGDWQPLPKPWLLWLNTSVLISSSIALQWALVSARRGQIESVRAGLLAGGVTTLLFLAGQLLAFRQLASAGFYLSTNPASSFFYLITVVHGLHLLGGLAALGRAAARLWRGVELARLPLSVELCAMYWHFLLLVWLVLFALLLHT